MKKKLLFPCVLLAVLMVLTCVATLGVGAEETMTMTAVAAGEKTPAMGDVVTIADEAELKAFSAYVSNGGATAGITFRLEADIALAKMAVASATNFNPIGGVYNGAAAPVPFLGTFDGNGRTVSGLVLDDTYYAVDGTYVEGGTDTSCLGFFALLGEDAVVKNLGLTVASATDINGQYFGVLASSATGATVKGCTIGAEAGSNIQLSNFGSTTVVVAGVIGYAENSVVDACKVNLSVNASNASAAGVVGFAKDTAIRNCVVSGSYTHTKAGNIGGIAAKLEGASTVNNCYSSANITLSSVLRNDVLGGIVGTVGAEASVSNCFSDASVYMGNRIKSGSLVGSNAGTVKHSFALRDPNAVVTVAHSDIGDSSGLVEGVSAYQPKTEGGVTSFLLGTIEKKSNVEIPCTDPNCPKLNGLFGDCSICNSENGYFTPKAVYYFVPAEGEGVSLVDALNAWVDENTTDDVKYQIWVVSGSNIINCDHNAPVNYVAYPGQTPTCSATGLGDKYCSACNVLLEANAAIPVNPDAHSTTDYPCVAYACEYCGQEVAPKVAHKIGDVHCQEQECSVCHNMIPASSGHTHPEGFDNTDKLCLEYTCAKCGDTRAKDAEHDMPEVEFACQEGIKCSVCEMEVAATKFHRPGRAANCTRNQVCLDCGAIVRKATGHTWGDPATCGTAQLCVNCGAPNPEQPATGEHIYDRESPDCLNAKTCTYCGTVARKALGHKLADDAVVDCGHGNSCVRCFAVIEPATSAHNVNWATATVIRAATAERTGIVEGTCSDCGRKIEAYTAFAAVEKDGHALVSGGNIIFYAGSRVDVTFGKVADYQTVVFAEDYVPLQVVTLSLADKDGNALSTSGNVTIKVVLNKSASKMALETLKLYSVENGQATEVAVTGIEDGYIVFTASGVGTFVLVAEEEAAYEVLGTLPVQPQQTAALIGTASYERREFDI